MSNLAILAIDAATEACSVALTVRGQQFQRFVVCPQQHSTVLLPMIDEVLTEANFSLAQLDGLAFGCGPGSFTGVRIGVGVAQGLAFAADLPMVAINSLQTMAQGVWRTSSACRIHCAIDARMGEVYCGEYMVDDDQQIKAVTDLEVLPPTAVKLQGELTVAGTGWQTYLNELTEQADQINQSQILYPDAQDMLALAINKLQVGEVVTAAEARPLYVRNTVTWKKLPGRK